MVGLQGSGKTTSTAKIAKRLLEQKGKRVLMASLDVRRPAAQQQLAILGEQVGVKTLPIVIGEPPVAIAKRAIQMGRLEGFDVVMLDTAGRLAIDEELMAEVAEVHAAAKPHETLLVADAMTGQDAVTVAKSFKERVNVTGIVLTRVDGDARGGAALSMRAITGCPIKLIGVGEKMEALEDFHADRIAGRILGMGDIVSLVEKAIEIDRGRRGRASRQEDAEGRVRPERPRQPAQAAAEDGRPRLDRRHAARHRQDAEAARRQGRRQGDPPLARDHLLDDAEGTAQPRPHQGLAQEPHRQGRRHAGAGHQQAAEAAHGNGPHDEAGQQAGPEGPDALRHGRAHEGRRRWQGGMGGGFPPFGGRR